MKFLVIATGIVALSSNVSFAQINLGSATSGIENWATNNPQATQALSSIATSNPTSLKAIASEDEKNPQGMSDFVNTAITNGSKGLDTYASTHKNWSGMNNLVQNHKQTLSQFAEWCKANPEAAKNLIKHPAGGLSYVTKNNLKL